jgi:hypothetical protein
MFHAGFQTMGDYEITFRKRIGYRPDYFLAEACGSQITYCRFFEYLRGSSRTDVSVRFPSLPRNEGTTDSILGTFSSVRRLSKESPSGLKKLYDDR